jgi:hypothetical protein
VEYKNLVRDFAVRTLKNLDAIDAAVAQNGEAEIYEVTQLINSMLGLLIFPQQRFFDSIKPTPLEELRSQGWPIPVMVGTPPRVQNLHDLMRFLRNGISHCNIEFTSDGHVITGMRIWNCPGPGKLRDWEAQLGLGELREIARKFIALVLEDQT